MPATQPEHLHEMFAAAVVAGDIEALLALYEPEAVTIHLDGNRYSGHAAIRRTLGDLIGVAKTFEGATRKIVAAGDLALTSATWAAEVSGPDRGTRQVSGLTTEVARRQPDGHWLFVIDDPMFVE